MDKMFEGSSTSTSSALLEQLVYIDNFMTNSSTGELTPNLDIDGQLSIDLAAFADDSFIFPDEEKKGRDDDDDEGDDRDERARDKRARDNNGRVENGRHNNGRQNNGRNNNGRDSRDEQGRDNNGITFRDRDDYSLQGLQNSNDQVPVPLLPEASANEAEELEIDLVKLPKFPVPPGAKSSLVSAGLSQNQIDLLSALIAQHQTSLGNEIPQSQQVPSLPSQQNIGDFFDSPVRQHNELHVLPPLSQNISNSNNMSQNLNLNNVTLSQIADISQNDTPNVSQNDTPSVSLRNQSISNLLSQSFTSETFTNEHGRRSSTSSINYSPDEYPQSSELDKRRRNTAASARFRIKKKMKEKQMENQLDTLGKLMKSFEGKVQQLEMENKLLRNLIIEKGSQKSDQELSLIREKARR